MQRLVARESSTQAWHTEVDELLSQVDRIIYQAETRVIDGQKVPSSEKIVSLAEPHTDIIVKGGRKV